MGSVPLDDATGNDADRTNDTRPEIVITTDEHLVNDQALAALAADPDTYQRGGQLVHVVTGGTKTKGINRPECSPRIAPLRLPIVRELLSKTCCFVREITTKDGTETRGEHPPKWSVEAIYCRGNYPGIRPLEGITQSPVLRPDGTILSTPGYDAQTCLLYVPNGEPIRIPGAPSKPDALSALTGLLDIVKQFPFANDVHKSAWVAAVLSVVARPAIDGPIPLFLFDANAPGSGKSLLAKVTGIICIGADEIPAMANPRNDDESRKRILAIAQAGDQIVLIDNVTGTLGFPSLNAALTATMWSDRPLGRSEKVSFPLRSVWFATANNAAITGETARRICHVRIECREENPEERTGFKYPNLVEYVRNHRGELLVAALTILRAYVLAGRPKAKLTSWGSYEAWSDLIRQCVVWLELPDPAETRVELRAKADDTATLRALLFGLAEADPLDEGMTTAEIIRAIELDRQTGSCEHQALRDAVYQLCDAKDNKPGARSLGSKLGHLGGRIIGGRALHSKEDTSSGLKRWHVEVAGHPSDSSDSSDSFTTDPYARAHAQARVCAGTEKDSEDSEESVPW